MHLGLMLPDELRGGGFKLADVTAELESLVLQFDMPLEVSRLGRGIVALITLKSRSRRHYNIRV